MNENTSTSTNERDTHFQNFAMLLWKELTEIIGESLVTSSANFTEFKQQSEHIKLLLAQRAYDLVYFLIESRYAHKGTFRGEICESISMLPDMTELPTPPQLPS